MIIMFNMRFVMLRVLLSFVVALSFVHEENKQATIVYLVSTIFNLLISWIKLQTNRYELVSSWLLDMCLILIGINFMIKESVLLSATVMFTIVFAQYFVLVISLLSVIDKHHPKVRSLFKKCTARKSQISEYTI